MTPGTKSGGGAEKDKHSAENDKNSAENDEIEVPKKSAETGGNQENSVQWVKFFILIQISDLENNFFYLRKSEKVNFFFWFMLSNFLFNQIRKKKTENEFLKKNYDFLWFKSRFKSKIKIVIDWFSTFFSDWLIWFKFFFK